MRQGMKISVEPLAIGIVAKSETQDNGVVR